jgi:hypothetical protein
MLILEAAGIVNIGVRQLVMSEHSTGRSPGKRFDFDKL